MQEKHNKRLFILLLVLLVVTGLVLYFQSSEVESFEQKDVFKIAELKTVDRLELISNQDTLSLHVANNRWWVNENQLADRDMIDVLFATLLQAQAKRPVPASVNDSIARALISTGIQVRLFEKNELKKNFFTGGNSSKTESYFSTEQGQAYIMHIPGYRVFVSGVFALPESDWRDKYVFAFNWTNFKDLSVQFPTSPSDNYVIKMQDNFFGIQNQVTDTTKLNDFLDAVSLLTVDAYTVGDSLHAQKPVQTIGVTDIAGRLYKLAVFNHSVNGKTACYLNDQQAAWIDNRKLSRLLKKREFFKK